MTKRELRTSALGGLVLFAWGSLVHVVVPPGAPGARSIPDEKRALVALSSSIGRDSGLYLFPAAESDSLQQYEQKLALYPSGLLVYHPPGTSGVIFRRLGVELLVDLVLALLVVWVLARSRASGFRGRVASVVAVGAVASIATNASYWNWVGFPLIYSAAAALTDFAGFVPLGLLAAARFRPRPEAKA